MQLSGYSKLTSLYVICIYSALFSMYSVIWACVFCVGPRTDYSVSMLGCRGQLSGVCQWRFCQGVVIYLRELHRMHTWADLQREQVPFVCFSPKLPEFAYNRLLWVPRALGHKGEEHGDNQQRSWRHGCCPSRVKCIGAGCISESWSAR